jgi:hypothetical protein
LSVLASIVLALSACKSDTPGAPSGPVDERVVLAPGESTSVPGVGTTIRFTGVTNDSRCPGDATCIWGGDAIVRIVVIAAGTAASAAYDLHTADLKPVQHGDLTTIALETLTPYPFASLGPIKPGDYRATLRITR